MSGVIKRQKQKFKLHPKIHIVKNKYKIPTKNHSGNIKATTIVNKTGTKQDIYVVKGKANQVDIEHEKGHIVLEHSAANNMRIYDFVLDELEAELYAYEKLNKPAHVKQFLRGVINSIWEEVTPQITYRQAYKYVKVLLFHLEDVPKTWKQDIIEMRKELNKIPRGR